MATNSFHIDSRLKAMKDIVRTFAWDLLIPQINSVCSTIKDPEDLIVRCKTATIPSRGNETIESYFHGMKQLFPGRPVFGNTINVTIEESADQKVIKSLYEWSNLIFNTDPALANAGGSQADIKRQGQGGKPYSLDMYLMQYAFNNSQLEKKILIKNAWISNIADVNLDYQSSDAVRYSVDFSFDYWVLA